MKGGRRLCGFARDVPADVHVHVHDYRSRGERECGREGVGERGEKEMKEERGIRAKKGGTKTIEVMYMYLGRLAAVLTDDAQHHIPTGVQCLQTSLELEDLSNR